MPCHFAVHRLVHRLGEHLSGVSCGFCGVAWPLAMLWQRSSVRTARARASMPLSQARPSTRALPLHPPSTLSDAADATQLYACMRHADSFPCATPTALHRPAEELAGVHDAVAQRPTTVSRPPQPLGVWLHTMSPFADRHRVNCRTVARIRIRSRNARTPSPCSRQICRTHP